MMGIGRFQYPITGYELTKVGDTPAGAVYWIRLSPISPLTYIRPTGEAIRPPDSYCTDMGSIPGPLQWVPGFAKDRFLLTYVMHDAAYCGHGLYFRSPGASCFGFRAMRRKDADALLYETVLAEGGSRLLARCIWLGVRAGGARAWDRHASER